MAKTLEFYFDLMSPFGYLASTQLDALAKRTGATVQWNPVYLPGIFRASGNLGPTGVLAKGIYSVKDMNDWAAWYDLRPIALPSRFPVSSAAANRVALSLPAEQVGPFAQHVAARIWHEDADISRPEVIIGSLTAVGVQNIEAVMAHAQSQEIKDLLRSRTEALVTRGAFGVPTFFVGDEMFVGNDRLQFVERALQ